MGISLSVGPELGSSFDVDSTRPSLTFSHVVSSPRPLQRISLRPSVPSSMFAPLPAVGKVGLCATPYPLRRSRCLANGTCLVLVSLRSGTIALWAVRHRPVSSSVPCPALLDASFFSLSGCRRDGCHAGGWHAVHEAAFDNCLFFRCVRKCALVQAAPKFVVLPCVVCCKQPRCSVILCSLRGKSDDPMNQLTSTALLAHFSCSVSAKPQATSEVMTQLESVYQMWDKYATKVLEIMLRSAQSLDVGAKEQTLILFYVRQKESSCRNALRSERGGKPVLAGCNLIPDLEKTTGL